MIEAFALYWLVETQFSSLTHSHFLVGSVHCPRRVKLYDFGLHLSVKILKSSLINFKDHSLFLVILPRNGQGPCVNRSEEAQFSYSPIS